MPEYVYVVHHFQPENEDELELRTTECVEVLEKDDEFGDGWWQVLFGYRFKLSLLITWNIGPQCRRQRGTIPS